MKEEEILHGLLNNNDKAYNELARQLIPILSSWILENNGTIEDAEDIFQDSLIVLLHLLKTDRFVRQDRLNWFLFSIQKRLWLKKLRNISTDRVINTPILEYIGDKDADIAILEYERYQLFQKHFARLSAKCQELLKLHLDNVDNQGITLIMGYANRNVTGVKKHQCQKKLLNAIRKDPKFNQ